MKILFAIGAALYGVGLLAGDYQTVCQKLPDQKPGGYCVHRPLANPSSDLVYYLHGSGLSEQAWGEEWYYPAQLRQRWAEDGAKLPTVISVSFGPVWLLAEKNSSDVSGLFETFTARVLPAIEQALGGRHGRRLVVGESMGGFNAVQLALKTSLFSKAAVLCAPMAKLSPFSSEPEIEAYLKTTSAWHYFEGADPQHNPVMDSVHQIQKLTQAFFPTEKEWQAADPLALARERPAPTTALYLAVGFYDRFAAYEGNQELARLLQAKGADIEWRPQWGGHCAIDIASLAAFLTR